MFRYTEYALSLFSLSLLSLSLPHLFVDQDHLLRPLHNEVSTRVIRALRQRRQLRLTFIRQHAPEGKSREVCVCVCVCVSVCVSWGA